MELTTRLAARLTHLLRHLRGTQEAFTLTFDDIFVQAASFDGDDVLVEITGDDFLPPDRRPTPAQTEELFRLGFTRPDLEMPNWWIGVEGGHERALYAAARAAITALTGIYAVPTEALVEQLPLSREAARAATTLQTPPPPAGPEGEPLAVHTTYGEVLLYPHGYATLNGEPWTDRPLREWQHLADGRLSIVLAIPSNDYFPHAGFVADTPDHVAVLRGFQPSVKDLTALALRLAVTEHYALTCIATGTQYHRDLARAAAELKDAAGAAKASDIVGWDYAPRLAAATAAVDAFWWSHSADNNRELEHDQEDTWRALQTWVRLSPWKDDFDFDLIPNPPREWALWSPEVEIQRHYAEK